MRFFTFFPTQGETANDATVVETLTAARAAEVSHELRERAGSEYIDWYVVAVRHENSKQFRLYRTSAHAARTYRSTACPDRICVHCGEGEDKHILKFRHSFEELKLR